MSYNSQEAKLEELINKILIEVTNNKNLEIVFVVEDGTVYKLCHFQDCCENVRIEDISGDLNDLVGTPILLAEEVSDGNLSKDLELETKTLYESCTWTFYKFRTIKGDVTVRWLGNSNGYYSEHVDFVKTLK